MGACGPWSCREHGAGAWWPKHASWPPAETGWWWRWKVSRFVRGGPEKRNDGGACQSVDACLCPPGVAPLLYSGACSVFDCTKSYAIPPAANADAHVNYEVNYYYYTPKR